MHSKTHFFPCGKKRFLMPKKDTRGGWPPCRKCHSRACFTTARQWRGCGNCVPPAPAAGSGSPQFPLTPRQNGQLDGLCRRPKTSAGHYPGQHGTSRALSSERANAGSPIYQPGSRASVRDTNIVSSKAQRQRNAGPGATRTCFSGGPCSTLRLAASARSPEETSSGRLSLWSIRTVSLSANRKEKWFLKCAAKLLRSLWKELSIPAKTQAG